MKKMSITSQKNTNGGTNYWLIGWNQIVRFFSGGNNSNKSNNDYVGAVTRHYNQIEETARACGF